MYVKSLKSLAVLGAFALMLAYSTNANAQTTVQASIETSAALTVTDGDDMNFGEWFLAVNAADDFLLTIDPAANTVVASGNVTSTATELTAAASARGSVAVTTPLGADGIILQMSRSAIVDFPDAGLTFQNPTYSTAIQPGPTVVPAGPATVPVTVVTGGTDEDVFFGGQINVTATPADAVHNASFTVSFSY